MNGDFDYLFSMGGTVSHGNNRVLYEDEDATKAVDDNSYTWWGFRKLADYPWVAWTFYGGLRLVANKYSVTNGRDSGSDPKHWKIYGSNDGVSWRLLDERENVIWGRRYERKWFVMSYSAEYNSYKFEFIERTVEETWYMNYQLADWAMVFDSDVPTVAPPTAPPTTPPTPTPTPTPFPNLGSPSTTPSFWETTAITRCRRRAWRRSFRIGWC